MRRHSILVLLAALALGVLCNVASASQDRVWPPGFVHADGSRFVVDGRAFRVAGVNNHYLTWASDAEVQRVLDDAVDMHANVVRIIVGPVIGSPDGSISTVFDWKATDKDSSNLGVHGRYMLSWDPSLGAMAINGGPDGLRRLDFVLAESRRRGLKLIVALLDFWAYTGGAQQIAAWYGLSDKYTSFARDMRTRTDYRTWAERVIRRVNSVNGVAYRDDPTIFSWELMNEPDIQPRSLMLDWVAEMSAFVKSLDSAHMVSTGHGNAVAQLADLDVKTVDFGTWHGYAEYEHISPAQFALEIHEFCALAAQRDKPLVLEEFGLAQSDAAKIAAYELWTSTLYREKGCAGWVVWRLVSKQDGGDFPADHDGFDVRNDGGELWRALRGMADRARKTSEEAELNTDAR